MKLSREVLFKDHQQMLDRLVELHPGIDFVPVWSLRHQSEVGVRVLCATVEAPDIPSNTDGWFLTRFYVGTEQLAHQAKDGVIELDAPQASSLPHSTVWSDTARAREVREFINAHPVSWPK